MWKVHLMKVWMKKKTYLEPCNGMEFNSHEEAYEFYLKYAKIIGFDILRRSNRRSKISNEFIDVKFVCTRSRLKRESMLCVFFDLLISVSRRIILLVRVLHSDGQKERSIHDLEVSKTKGAPKRIKSRLENSRKRKSNDKSKKGHAISKDKSTTCTDTLHLNLKKCNFNYQLKQDSREYIFLNDDECINGTILNHLCTLTKNYLQIECDYEALLYHYMIFMSYF
ncbi:hypothetical protein G4B88_017713 [Cannabis sativa]|uniref:FAR1 domain-containing protein n=1 Tax=Cannabis sativa TaxID=3483 RepID=A0A7J6I570_CANSA|nr:hypothetical protein G4B88_017713 [Cannabis sativa]